MNIIKFLKDKGITSTIRYYGTADLATGFEVKNIVEKKDIINGYLEKIKPQITTIDEYIDYLYLRCEIQYEEVIPLVREDLRDEFTNQIIIFKEKYKGYQKKDLTLFVKENYKNILKNKYTDLYIEPDVVDFTVEILLNAYNSDTDDEIIEYIIENFSYLIYDNFDSCKKIFDNDKEHKFYEKLLEKKILEEDSQYRLDEICNVLQHLKKKNIDIYKDKLANLIKIIRKRTFNANVDNVINKYYELKNFTKKLKEFREKDYYIFEKELKKQEPLIDEYLKHHGKSIPFEINIKPIIDVLENDKKEWYTKSLSITHTTDKENTSQIISNLEYAYKYFARSKLTDFISTNKDTDDVFTFSVLNNLSLTMMCGKHVIFYIMNDDNKLNDLFAYILRDADIYFGQDCLYFNMETFEIDINMLFDAFKELRNAIEQNDDIKIKWKIYATEMLLCGIIEKLLRNIYYEKTKNEKFVSFDSLTIGSLIKTKELKSEMGEFNCLCLEYYLSKREGNIGNNNRNDFGHFNDNMYSKLTIDTVLEELYFLLTISNSLLVKVHLKK